MATIDIKLKSYDELIFEITKLNTDKYLLEQENKQLKKENKKLREEKYRAIEYLKAVGTIPKQIDSFVVLEILGGKE